jgi:hypothetical protein
MSAPLDLAKVRKALLADPAFNAGTPEQARSCYLELVDALPEVLKDHLAKNVTLTALIEAKLAMVEHMLESGFIGKMFAAVPADILPCTPAEMTEMVVDGLKHLRMPFKEVIDDAQAFLAENGVTERQVLASAQGGGCNAKTLAAYDKGKLTIRSLLETQPAVLFING